MHDEFILCGNFSASDLPEPYVSRSKSARFPRERKCIFRKLFRAFEHISNLMLVG